MVEGRYVDTFLFSFFQLSQNLFSQVCICVLPALSILYDLRGTSSFELRNHDRLRAHGYDDCGRKAKRGCGCHASEPCISTRGGVEVQSFCRTGRDVFGGIVEDEVANATAFERTRRLQVFELQKYFATKPIRRKLEGKGRCDDVPACSF